MNSLPQWHPLEKTNCQWHCKKKNPRSELKAICPLPHPPNANLPNGKGRHQCKQRRRKPPGLPAAPGNRKNPDCHQRDNQSDFRAPVKEPPQEFPTAVMVMGMVMP